jgi:3',5'-cyclic AMP phosphodiesterase CpdA
MTTDNKTITVAHISDLHLPITQKISPFSLLGKRILGYANLKFKRSATHKAAPFEKLLERLKQEEPDITILSGDLVNLSLPSEFEQIAALLDSHGFTRENLFIIPGNHDRYTPLASAGRYFEHYMAKWLPDDFAKKGQYPIIIKRGPITIAGLDTAIWRGPFRAAGWLPKQQRDKLKQFLKTADVPLVVMHHPPFALTDHFLKQYLDGLQLLDPIVKILNSKPVTILHGHTHILSHVKSGNMEIFGVSSASNDTGTNERQMAFNLYTFNEQGLKNSKTIHYWPQKNI